jgi:hypothetical protein
MTGIDMNDAGHLAVLHNDFPRFIGNDDYPEHSPADAELTHFYTQNSQFSWLDSCCLFAMMRARPPQRIVEVGSGYSSLLMADVHVRFLANMVDITCIEPFPRDFLRRGVDGLARVLACPFHGNAFENGAMGVRRSFDWPRKVETFRRSERGVSRHERLHGAPRESARLRRAAKRKGDYPAARYRMRRPGLNGRYPLDSKLRPRSP